jgi:hypothetical protein
LTDPLTWGVVANVSRYAFISQGATKRPGTRHFVPGAKVWVIGRDRLRFLRGDHDPRQLDGVVHAWLDAGDRVVRTKSG